MKKYKIFILHLSHTDIGYKDTQAKIKSLQVQNLLYILKTINKYDNFSWNIESFGVLNDFLDEYPEYKDKLVEMIKKKKIGISTNFWNYTKIASPFLINRAFLRVKNFISENNINEFAKSLITNDINGFSKDWAIKAYEHGTRNLYFGLHWAHGYFPAWKKQEPFYWKLDDSRKMLVWIGEQYAVGNNFGIVPGPISDYIASDGKTAGFDIDEQIKLANTRMKDLIEQLETDNYQFKTIPITVLGSGADNDPINYEIHERVKLLEKEWAKFGVESIRVTTLQEFFNEIRKEKSNVIPTYSGEWPDWWSDGAASNPFALKAFKEAQRSYEVYLKLGNKEILSIENNLLLYSEHTYGTEWSTFKPYSFYNKQTEELKKTFALKALEEVKIAMDKELEYKSSKVLNEDILNIELFNPTNVYISKRINLKRFFGVFEHSKFLLKDMIIKDGEGSIIPHSISVTKHPKNPNWSEKDIMIHVFLKPNEKKKIIINLKKYKNKISKIANQYETKFGEMPDDIVNIKSNKKNISYYNGFLKTKYSKMIFNDKGLVSFKYHNKELINFKNFSPLKYVDVQNNNYFVQYNKREESGRNIISKDSLRKEGRYIKHYIDISDDKENVEVLIYYELHGCQFFRVRYKISNYDPLVEISIELLNNPTWSNETLFFSMPHMKYSIEYGSLYEVNKGQIPGTLVNYHSLNEGLVYDNFKINFLDSSVIYTGPIIFSQNRLAQDPEIDNNIFKEHYAILTTNNWNTNFSLDQGGFHEFRFVLSPIIDKELVVEELFAQAIELPIKRD